MKIEEFKNNEVREAEAFNKTEKVLQNAQDHKVHKERLEDYSYKDLFELAKTDPAKVTRLNVDFRERYEAESRDMTRNEYREHKIEDKLRKFSCVNFSKEDSFDTYAKEKYPQLNELKSKTVCSLYPMGNDPTELKRASVGEYTEREKKYIKDIRDKIDAPTIETVMQKVIGVFTGNVDEDLKKYLKPYNEENGSLEPQVYGFVAKAQDVAPFTQTPQECYDNLRLDYDGTRYKDANQSVYVIRYTDGENYEIPYGEGFGGHYKKGQPFTENGFIGSEKITSPEFIVKARFNGDAAVVTDGIIYKISPEGKEEPIAFFNKHEKCFEILKKEGD